MREEVSLMDCMTSVPHLLESVAECSPTDLVINELLHRRLEVSSYLASLKEMQMLFGELMPDLMVFLNAQLGLQLNDFDHLKRTVVSYAMAAESSLTLREALGAPRHS